MSPGQCRAARVLLGWTQGDLANAADAPLWFVMAFEDWDASESLVAFELDLREALEAAGIEFGGDA